MDFAAGVVVLGLLIAAAGISIAGNNQPTVKGKTIIVSEARKWGSSLTIIGVVLSCAGGIIGVSEVLRPLLVK